MFRLITMLGFGSRTPARVGAVAATLLTFILIPLLGYAQADGRSSALATARSTARSSVTKGSPHNIRAVRIASWASASLGPLETTAQTLNNCGPSSVAAVLAYWHVYRSEAQVAALLRADNSYWGYVTGRFAVVRVGLSGTPCSDQTSVLTTSWQGDNVTGMCDLCDRLTMIAPAIYRQSISDGPGNRIGSRPIARTDY